VTELLFDDPCILFAMRRESAPLLREFRVQDRFPAAPCWARFCGPAWLSVLVLETGVGPTRMKQAIDWVLSRPRLGNVVYRPKLVLSAGFSGALEDALRVGDIILATEVCDAAGNVWPAPWPGELPSGTWKPILRRARVVTAQTLAGTPKEKEALGQSTGAAAVDMEAAVIAQSCSRHGIPFGCVRAISDAVQTPLSPRLVALLRKGRVSIGRVGLASLRSPSIIPELWHLARATRFAAEQLGKALGELLTLTLPWATE
jgi:adenosylhomocysteine nucleosidase